MEVNDNVVCPFWGEKNRRDEKMPGLPGVRFDDMCQK